MDKIKAHTQEEFKTFMSQLLETNANLGFYTDFAKCHLPLCLLQLDNMVFNPKSVLRPQCFYNSCFCVVY